MVVTANLLHVYLLVKRRKSCEIYYNVIIIGNLVWAYHDLRDEYYIGSSVFITIW